MYISKLKKKNNKLLTTKMFVSQLPNQILNIVTSNL